MKYSIKALISWVVARKFGVLALFLVLPVILLLPASVLPKIIEESRYEGLLVLNYILSIGLLGLVLKIYESWQNEKKFKNIVRSPFHFIKGFNLTYNQDYWDKYQMPLRHLVGAEIGVFRGSHAQQIMNGYLNIDTLVLVDPWVPYIDEASSAAAYSSSKVEFDTMYAEVKKMFSANSKISVVRDFSVNAALAFEDGHFDFIYLDGDHGYSSVLNDLEAWYPKLKQFGVMCGDDYGSPSGVGVVKAVTEFARKYGVLVSSSVEDKQFWFIKT